MTRFLDPFSEETWKLTYKDFADEDVDSTFKRVAKNIASAEKTEELRKEWQEKFYDLLSDFKGVPGGRIISNAGTKWKNTFHNCFLGARVDFDPDSIQGIMQHLTWQVLTLKSEGGWGENFSYIRPRGSFIHGIGVETPGAVKYMELFDKASDVITAGSGKKSSKKESKGKIRKGALMGTLDVWHPDIEEFITAKQSQGRLEKFNISANCTDEFMNRLIKVLNLEQSGASKEEIEKEDKWDLCFPDTQHTLYKKEWDGDFKSWKDKGYPYIVYKTVSCRYLWNLIMFSTYNRNDPGVLFLDRANFFYPMNYAAKITGTNPCLTADTWIFTDNGPKQIKDLIGIKFSTILSSGKYESTDQGFFSSGEKEIYEIIANNGLKIKGTADHLLLTAKGWKEIQELDSNDQLIIENCSHEWGDSNEFQKGWLLGSLYGDGNFDENSANLDYWGESKYEMQEIAKKYLNDNFNVRSDVGSGNGSPERDRTRLSSKNLGEFAIKLGLKKEHSNSKKYSEDLEKTSSSFQKGFLSGWFDADGSPQGHHVKGVSVRLCSIDLEMLEFAQRSLLRFGILSKIFKNRKEEGYRFLPDGKGGSKEYFCQTVHELVITNKSIQTFYEKIGFKERKKQERLKNYIADYKRKINSDKFFTKINSITKLGIEEVYDCSIPVVNAFNANGLRAHNCGEQVMPSGDICTLGTLNLTQFILEDYSDFDYEKIIKYAKILTRFLDNVNDLSIMPVEDYEKNMKERRRIGCGLMGWGSSLYMLRVRFASKKAEEIRRKLLKEFARAVYEESIDLAKEKGMFPLCEPEKHINAEFLKNLDLSKYYLDDLKVYGIRNSSCLSMQPNGNSSIFVNIVSGGEEPVFLPEYIRTVIVSSTPEHFKNLAPRWEEGEFKETEMFKFTKEGNDVLLRGVDEKTGIVYKIDKNRGLTKEVECMDYGVRNLKSRNLWDPNADYAVTALTLSVKEHVDDFKDFCKYVDSACSKTINIANDYPFEEFKDLYLDAYKTGFIKGLTTYRVGTSSNVLAAKTTSDQQKKEELFNQNDAAKRPKSLDCELHNISIKGDKWLIIVGLLDGKPYEIFGGKSDKIEIPTKIKSGRLIKNGTKLKSSYDLVFSIMDEDFVIKNIISVFDNVEYATHTRLLSLALRHGTPVKYVVEQLQKDNNSNIFDFSKVVARCLKKYIPEEEKSSLTCDNCGEKSLSYREGCIVCTNCGSSKCG